MRGPGHRWRHKAARGDAGAWGRAASTGGGPGPGPGSPAPAPAHPALSGGTARSLGLGSSLASIYSGLTGHPRKPWSWEEANPRALHHSWHQSLEQCAQGRPSRAGGPPRCPPAPWAPLPGQFRSRDPPGQSPSLLGRADTSPKWVQSPLPARLRLDLRSSVGDELWLGGVPGFGWQRGTPGGGPPLPKMPAAAWLPAPQRPLVLLFIPSAHGTHSLHQVEQPCTCPHSQSPLLSALSVLLLQAWTSTQPPPPGSLL